MRGESTWTYDFYTAWPQITPFVTVAVRLGDKKTPASGAGVGVGVSEKGGAYLHSCATRARASDRPFSV